MVSKPVKVDVSTYWRDLKTQNIEDQISQEIAGYRINSDGTDYVLPNSKDSEEASGKQLKNANLQPDDIDLVSTAYFNS